MIPYEILIPAYNASGTLPILLEKIQHLNHPPEAIRIVDDGSGDQTAEIVKNFPLISIIQNNKNYGKGHSLKQGFRQFLIQGRTGYVLCMDADLQHPPEWIEKFLNVAEEKDSSIVIGWRRRQIFTMPVMRILSNGITSFILTLITGQKIKDSQCGFRLIRRGVLEKIELHENGFQLETEFILKAAQNNFTFDFVEIPTIYNGSHSYIRHLGDTLTFVKLIIKRVLRWD